MRFCRLNQPEKSALAEHALNNLSHDILFQDMKILSRASNFYVRLQREAIEIYKHPNNINRQVEDICLNKAWHLILKHVRQMDVHI